jgi:hypothetical protein
MFSEDLFEMRKTDAERVRAQCALFQEFNDIFQQSDFAKLALILECEAVGIGENKEHSRMLRRLLLMLEIPKRAGHAEMQSEPDVAVRWHKKMLAMTAAGFEPPPFQSVCKLKRGDALQNILAPNVDIDDALMQRRGVEVSPESLDIGQLWHRRSIQLIRSSLMNNVRGRVGFRHTPHRRSGVAWVSKPGFGIVLRPGIRSLVKFMSAQSIGSFIRLLKKSPSGPVFNPWWQVDQENDISRNAPGIRRKQVHAYFCKRLGKARLAVIGEALGYRGGHFSGIPMTSERILLGKKEDAGVEPHEVFSGIPPRRTSKPQRCSDGFSEPTATIVWSTLLRLGIAPEQFVLWNAFPWHSFDSRRGMLSNRMPNKSERAAGLTVLKAFLELFSCDQVVALGKIAAAQLEELNVNAHCIRHPASGGAKLFRHQIGKIARKVR